MTLLHYSLALVADAGPEGKQLIKFGYLSTEILLVGSLIMAAVAVPWAMGAAKLAADSAFARLFRTRLHRILAVTAIIFVPMTLLQFSFDAAKAAKVSLGDGASPAALGGLLSAKPDDGAWLGGGGQWIITLALSVATVAAAVALLRMRTPRGATLLARAGAVAATLLVLADALPASFAHTDAKSLIGPVASQTHVLASAVWVGGLILLTLLLWPLPGAVKTTLRGDAADFWPQLWQRFSALAMWSLGLIILSGGWLTWVHVGSVSQMFTTPYGVALTVKIIIVAAMVVLGGIHQLHLIPRIHRARREGREGSVFKIALSDFRITVLAEALLGVAVLVIVPLLSGSARKQAALAANPNIEAGQIPQAVFDGGVLAMAAAGLAVMVLLFWASSRVSVRRSAA
jgi:copper transport protein